MSASLAKIDYSTRMAVFFIDSEEDLVSLPTMTNPGTGNLSTVSGIAQGSMAKLTNTDSTYYRLRGDGTWIKIETGGGGGGGVTSYNQLTDKPQINSVTLEGNKSSDDLDVQPESRVEGEQLIFDQNQFGFGINIQQ